jgi:hypothetical protein
LEKTLTIPLQHAKSATDAAGDLFLSGSYIELGVSPWGNFGTTQGQTPAGYAQAGSRGVGLTYNQAGFGVNGDIPTIDYFTPGTPYESSPPDTPLVQRTRLEATTRTAASRASRRRP